jgi:leucyl aminopeptidase
MTKDTSTAPRRLRWVDEASLAARKGSVSQAARDWIEAHAFAAERGRVLALPGVAGGAPEEVWVGLGTGAVDLALALGLPDRLPAGHYCLADDLPEPTATTVALGFALGAYRFDRYRALAQAGARLVTPKAARGDFVAAVARADALARDLINTPAQDMGPSELSAAVADVARRHGATFEAIVGDDLLSAGYPAVHAVGRSGAQAPRLLTLQAGSTGPLVALVGKGVCFDTGGLDLKPASGMALMKKDMGGAAVALAVAELVLALQLPIRLLLVIPAVENGVGPQAYRPGDVLQTRQGLTVEVTNTDAEGRIVLADALTRASQAKPDLMIDFATLTGAARVALGPELPAAYGSDEALLAELAEAARAVADPLWPMPLWRGYDDELQSRIADLQNASSSGFAGSITAALFLRRFVPNEQHWIHLDLYAWNPKDRPGRPVGAEAHTVRAVVEWLQRRYGARSS